MQAAGDVAASNHACGLCMRSADHLLPTLYPLDLVSEQLLLLGFSLDSNLPVLGVMGLDCRVDILAKALRFAWLQQVSPAMTAEEAELQNILDRGSSWDCWTVDWDL